MYYLGIFYYNLFFFFFLSLLIISCLLLFVVGDITQKGYEKKRGRLLAPFMPKETSGIIFFLIFLLIYILYYFISVLAYLGLVNIRYLNAVTVGKGRFYLCVQNAGS